LGTHVDESDIRKHRNDVLRLSRLLAPDTRLVILPSIRRDMHTFLEGIKSAPVDLKNLGINDTNLHGVITALHRAYCEDFSGFS